MEMKRRMSMLLVLPLAFALPTPASAHASLVRAIPAGGSAVYTSPTTVKLWFSERLEPAYCAVEVVDQTRKRVDNGDAGVDRSDAKLLQVSLPQLPAGRYRVMWRVLSVDTHVSEGHFSFEIAP
jgi:methionine-rich copper-binding protein CopC